MPDFSLTTYRKFLKTLQESSFSFITFAEYMKGKRPERFVILRHDVDKRPVSSLHFAQIQERLGIKGTYYFPEITNPGDKKIIREIHQLGHEIGYHYECLATTRGDKEKAIALFEHNLIKLREIVPVSSICMHGSPLSPHDSKDLWKNFDYRKYDLLGEPYLDTDFSELFYLTDTGRRWDGWKVSIRDKMPRQQEEWIKQGLVFRSTHEIINRIQTQNVKRKTSNTKPHQPFPSRLMITFHPQRWTDKPAPWLKELLFQNIKNIGKRVLMTLRKD